MNLYKYITLIVLLSPLGLMAQNNESSPYSAFGLGETKFDGTVESVAMGGLNSTFWNLVQTNPSNPASYSFLSYTNYSISFFNQDTYMSTDYESEKNNHSGINHLIIGIPMGKLGGALGFMPTSSTGYNITGMSEEIVPALARPNLPNPYDGSIYHLYNYTGSGGMNRFFMGLSYRPFKGFSVGVNFNYEFGNLNRNIMKYTPPVYHIEDLTVDSDSYNTIKVFDGSMYGAKEEQLLKFRDWTYDLGVLYTGKLAENFDFTIGGTYTIGQKSNVEHDRYLYSFKFDADGMAMPLDTLSKYEGDYLGGKVVLPHGYKGGISIGNYSKWMLGVNYEYSGPVNLFYGHDNLVIKHTEKQVASIGGFWTPKYNSLMSYWERVTYRAGFKYQDLGLEINGIEIVDYSVSAGVSLPLRNGMSTVNIAAIYGTRGTTQNGLIKENYFKLMLSVSLSDKWFRKVLYN